VIIKNCPGIDGYEVVTASKSERTVRVIEKVMDENNVKTYFVINLKTKFNFKKNFHLVHTDISLKDFSVFAWGLTDHSQNCFYNNKNIRES